MASFLPGRLPFQPVQAAGKQARAGAKASARSRPRFLYVLGFFMFWAAVICLRLIWLQVVMRHVYIDKALHQQQKTFDVLPRRGILYDRNLHELAVSVLADSVFVVPYEIASSNDPVPVAQAKLAAVAEALAKVVHTDPDDSFTSAERIYARMNASRDYAWVARGLDPLVVKQVKALNLKGVHIQQEFKRFYPDGQIAAQVLGYVGTDATGLGGLEQNFEDDLHGTPGQILAAIDAKHHMMGSQQSEPVPGENLVLTIDENIQFMAEQALDRNMERTHAQSGTVVVQDPHTGQILALAIRPTFDPNDFRHATGNLLKNHAVSDVYEPGSTFKPVTYAAALEEKAITPDTIVDCGGGQLNIAGHTVHDAPGDHFGLVPAWKAFAVSSNVCAIHVGQRVGPDQFYKYIRAFGFGDRTGVELPGETRGLLEPLRRWGPASMGAIPMGQEIGVTPIQIVTMVSTLANGGVYVPPHILLRSTDLTEGDSRLKPAAFHPESSLPDPLPDGAHRVVSEMTAAQMRKMMEDVVLIGTAHEAVHLNGYGAAGKTGTAQKIDPSTHTYSKTNFVASFVGFAPVNNPAIAIAVVMDSPVHSLHFGAQASAPVFQDLAQQILEYLGVPHDQEMRPQKELAKITVPVGEDDEPEGNEENLNALFAAVNDLPADDPLRAPKQAAEDQRQTAGSKQPAPAVAMPPASMPAATPMVPTAQTSPPAAALPLAAATDHEPSALPANGAVIVDSSKRVAVPSFLGEPVRHVVEVAGTTGLAVQVMGNGLAREQAPAPGTMVPAGTRVVVRFTR